MSTSTTPRNDLRSKGINRRSVVRAGAWTVPVVAIAAAAPALAVSGMCCDLSSSGTASWQAGGLNYLEVALQIDNRCGTAVAGLTVTLTICGVDGITYSGADQLPAGWTQAGTANQALKPDANGCYTLTYMSAVSLGGRSSVNPTFLPKTKAYIGSGKRPGATVTATVSGGGCTAAPTTLTVSPVG